MSLWKYFVPSTVLLASIVIIFSIMAYTITKNPNINPEFINTGKDLLKILAGATAGALSGEKYAEYIKNGT